LGGLGLNLFEGSFNFIPNFQKLIGSWLLGIIIRVNLGFKRKLGLPFFPIFTDCYREKKPHFSHSKGFFGKPGFPFLNSFLFPIPYLGHFDVLSPIWADFSKKWVWSVLNFPFPIPGRNFTF